MPWVPRPAPDELLGSWLLRVAQLYGLSLTTLLNRLDARPTRKGGECAQPWFALRSVTLDLDALCAVTHLPQAALMAMAPAACTPRWPEELGACKRCLACAANAGQPITWSRSWMSPLATTCRIHGTWLTPLASRALRRIRNAGDFSKLVQHLAAQPDGFNNDAPCADDARWLHESWNAEFDLLLPWGRMRHHELMQVIDSVAREVIFASVSGDGTCEPRIDRQAMFTLNFVLQVSDDQQQVMSLPTRLRPRHGVLGHVAHILRWPLEARTFCSSWSATSVKRLASGREWPEGALAWVCPKAAELVQLDEALRRQLSISPSYFKASAALFASVF